MIKVKNICFLLVLLLSNFCVAQDIVLKDLSKENNSKVKFKGDWSLIENNPNYEIFGESISNTDKANSNNIVLEAYLVPTDTLISIKKLPNQLINPLSLGKISANNSADLNLKIKLDSNQLLSKKANHKIVLTLKEKNRNNILDYKILNTDLSYNTRSLNQNISSENSNSAKTSNKEIVNKDGEKINFYISKKPSKLKITGDWALNVSFLYREVEVYGKNNNIENNSPESMDNILFVVFLSPNKLKPNDSNLSGYNLTSFNYKSIPAESRIENFKITASIDNNIPRGSYYSSLLMLQRDENGIFTESGLINFKDKVVIK